MKINARRIQMIGLITLILGVLMITPLLYGLWQKQHALASATQVVIPSIAPEPETPKTVSGHPIQLIIPSLGIDVPVVDGSYNSTNGEWTLFDTKAQYALPTVLPNDTTGNTLIYGHYNKYVFKKLPNIADGAEVIILTTEGYRFIYSFTSLEAVAPTNVDVFLYKGPSRLTIQTCTGRFMQNRQLHYFNFVRYEII